MGKSNRVDRIKRLLESPTEDERVLLAMVRDVGDSVNAVFREFLKVTPNRDLRFAVCSAFVTSGLFGIIEEYGVEKARDVCREILETDLWKLSIRPQGARLN